MDFLNEEITKEFIIYTVGFFDGEGSITIAERHYLDRGKPSRAVDNCSICMSVRWIEEVIKRFFDMT